MQDARNNYSCVNSGCESLQPMTRTAKTMKRISEKPSTNPSEKNYILVPSGWPKPYNISFGWKAKELNLGINGEGKVRNGAILSPVCKWNDDSGSSWFTDLTTIFCARHLLGLMADDLANHNKTSTLNKTQQATSAEEHSRSEDICQRVSIKRRKSVRLNLPWFGR